MTEKSWLDLLGFLFDLDPGAVRERDDATREKLEELLKSDSEDERFVSKLKNVNF